MHFQERVNPPEAEEQLTNPSWRISGSSRSYKQTNPIYALEYIIKICKPVPKHTGHLCRDAKFGVMCIILLDRTSKLQKSNQETKSPE